MNNTTGFELKRLTLADLPQLLEIENSSFSHPWSSEAYRMELSQNDMAHYFGVFADGRLAAYAGFWLIFDEAHICNVAVTPKLRRQGLSRLLMQFVMGQAAWLGACRMTLEVRASNEAAITLYQKLGFVAAGSRPHYYEDNDEDALIMWAELGDRSKI